MPKEYTLFIFRRDLRLTDNLALIQAMEDSDNIIPIFIFTPEQIGSKNPYRSENAIQFMMESLQELDRKLKKNKSRLHLFQGENLKVLKSIASRIDVTQIFFNKDYTPYARKRDREIKRWAKKKGIRVCTQEDYLLAPIGSMLKSDGEPYTVFTPFKNNGKKQKIAKPIKNKIRNLTKVSNLKEKGWIKYSKNPNLVVQGGRKAALRQLKKARKQKKYNTTRNTLKLETTQLSAYLKFGCLSIRETYHDFKQHLGNSNQLLDQLFWREFYYYVAYYFPRVLKGKNYNEKYDDLKWRYSKKQFEAWCEGNTGYPVIDAGMREMNATGYMHNRARLFTSNFMNRMLGQDWRKGERYYATQLTDYDPAVNNGNWQWIASTGVDPKPYFQRLFNPWLQGQKFDPQAVYIKKWLPELKDIPPKHLHQWDRYCEEYDLKKLGYPKPIVEYKEARKLSVEMYRKAIK